MASIRELVATAVADGQVTPQEWFDVLKPALFSTEKRASDEARAVVEVYASDRLEVASTVRSDMRDFLRTRGYDAPNVSKPTPGLLRSILDSNVGEVDRDFEQLSALTGTAKNTTLIAIADGGFDLHHPATQGKLWNNPAAKRGDKHGWNFASDNKYLEYNRHGAHVFGLATAGSERIKAILCRTQEEYVDANAVVRAIDYAAAKGARVINMSFGIELKGNVAKIVAAMRRHPEILFVESAGNAGAKVGSSGFTPDRFLAAVQLPNFMSVAAAEADGRRAKYSKYGAGYVAVGARGSKVLSTVPGEQYDFDTGTSMASPNVVNVAAKVLMLASTLNAAELKRLLIETCERRPDWTTLVASGGLVDKARAMRLAALIGLTRGGEPATAAADRLQLHGVERERLLALLPTYVAAGPQDATGSSFRCASMQKVGFGCP